MASQEFFEEPDYTFDEALIVLQAATANWLGAKGGDRDAIVRARNIVGIASYRYTRAILTKLGIHTGVDLQELPAIKAQAQGESVNGGPVSRRTVEIAQGKLDNALDVLTHRREITFDPYQSQDLEGQLVAMRAAAPTDAAREQIVSAALSVGLTALSQS